MSSALKKKTPAKKQAKDSNKALRIGIVVSDWNTSITNALFEGAMKALIENGVPSTQIYVKRVPGSFELTYGAQQMAEQMKLNAIVCLGCVIQGETRHFEFICNAVANGITNIGIQYKLPVIFGVLTTDTLKQAKARSGGKYGNKGEECAIAAIQMAH